MFLPNTRFTELEQAIRGTGQDRIVQAQNGHWLLTIANGTAFDVEARLVNDRWLEMRSPLPAAQQGTAVPCSSLLGLNARFPGCARVAVAAYGELELRAEINVASVDRDDEEGLAVPEPGKPALDTRVTALCNDMRSAHHDVLTLDPAAHDCRLDSTDVGHPGAEGLLSLCEAAGWPGASRASGRVEVPLETRGAAFTVTLDRCLDGRLEAVVPLTPSADMLPASREAVALLLLRASSIVRMVKATTVRHADADHFAIAAACEQPVLTATEMRRTLTALAVGCQLVSREALALRDTSLATRYLSLQRWPIPQHRDVPIQLQQPSDNPTREKEMPCLQLP